MIEILPIKHLRNEDGPIFGSLNLSLGKLAQAGLPIASGIVVSPPNLKLKTTLEHYDFGKKEIFEQTLALVKKEINSIPVPEILRKEVGKHEHFLLAGIQVKSVKTLWLALLDIWLEEIKGRLWKDGFVPGLTEGLESQVVIFIGRLEASGKAYEDKAEDDVVIETLIGELSPQDAKRLIGIVQKANKKLIIPHSFEWILDGTVKFTKVVPFTDSPIAANMQTPDVSMLTSGVAATVGDKKSAVKVFYELSDFVHPGEGIDGVYIPSEKIFDLNKPQHSFEQLVYQIVEAALAFPQLPILVKLADKSEGMGKVRGTLRLLHQKSLLDPILEALDFIRHKKGLTNVHLVVPFVRSSGELAQIKRELSTKKLMRKTSLQQWLEIAVPENLINLENYLGNSVDGVVLNLDELIAYLNGFDHQEAELVFYKNEVSGLIKFLEDPLKLLHKVKVPFIAAGSSSLYPEVLEFLVEKGVYGVVVEKYEAHSAHDLLHQAERRLILRKSV